MKLDRFRPLTVVEKDRIRQEIIASCELMPDGGCWVYRGTLTANGYGMKYIQGKMRPVGRFMLAYKTRESMDIKADACHGTAAGCTCTNPDADCCCADSLWDCPRSCVNPDHLFWGDHDNNCRERESVSFRFGRGGRKMQIRSLASGKARRHAPEPVTPLFSYDVSSHSWVPVHVECNQSIAPIPCIADMMPLSYATPSALPFPCSSFGASDLSSKA